MTTPPTPSALAHPRPDLRIGDAERLATSAVLQDAAALGRLTLDELDERLASLAAARTAPELAALVSDLPGPPRPRDRTAQLRRAGPVLLTVLVVVVLIATASARAGFPVVWPAVLLLVLWGRSRGRPGRHREPAPCS